MVKPSDSLNMGDAHRGVSFVSLAVLGVYFLLSVALTFPMALHPAEFYSFKDPGSYDMPIFLWEFWWFKKAIFDLGHQPFFSDYIAHPTGADLTFQSHAPIYSLLSVPLQLLFGEPGIFLSYNLFVLLSFTLCGWGTYLLANYVLSCRSAAFLSGTLFAFCGLRLLNFSRLHVLSMEFMPFFLLYLMKTVNEKERKNAYVAALLLALTFYNTFTNFLNVLLLAGCLLLVEWAQKGNALLARDRLTRFCLASFLFVLLCTPLLYLIWQHILSGNPSLYRGLEEIQEFSLDLARLFIPTRIDSLYGTFFRKLPLGPYEHTFSYFLGFVPIYLILVALTKVDRKKTLPWALSAAVLFILSLGPYLTVLGWPTSIPLPSIFLYKYIPVFQIAGAPHRIATGVYLCLAIVAGYGATCLLREVETVEKKNPENLVRYVRYALMAFGLFLIIAAIALTPSWTRQLLRPDKWLPYALVARIHLLQIILGFVGAVIFLVAFLSRRHPAFRRALRLKTLVVAALSMLIVIESVDTFPVLKKSGFKALPFHRQLAADGEDYAILDLPNVGFFDRIFMLYQVYHGKRIIFACLRRADPTTMDFFNDVPLLRRIRTSQHTTRIQTLTPPSPEEIALNHRKMKEYGIKYVILHNFFGNGASPEYREEIRRYRRYVEQYEPVSKTPFKWNVAYQFWP